MPCKCKIIMLLRRRFLSSCVLYSLLFPASWKREKEGEMDSFKETTLERADIFLRMVMFVTSKGETKMFTLSCLTIFLSVVAP